MSNCDVALLFTNDPRLVKDITFIKRHGPGCKFFSSAKGEIILRVTQVQFVTWCLVQRGRAVGGKARGLACSEVSYNGFEELVSPASWEEAR